MLLRVKDEGEWQGREVTLEPGRSITLGSGGECDLSLPGAPGVEETHCVIRAIKQGGFGVKDLGSSGGTWVNGRRVQVARLAAGDLLRLGDLTLACLAAEPEAAAAEETDDGAEAPAVEARRGGLPPRAIDLERIGTEIGGYRIEDYLGRGGMGTVFRATQVSLQRMVALKLLRRELTRSRTFVDKFVSEGRAAARFNHPNVVHVYDVGQEEGIYFLSMELMDGGSLEQLLAERGRLTPEEAVHAIHDAAKGLHYAEEAGVVHRDIKPDNLMRNSRGTTKIADLGLATSADDEEEHRDGKRKIFGTPHFIAPEQARGEAVDIRSDIYSLGCTFYRLVTGRTPFQGDTVKEILRQQLTAEPEPPHLVAEEVPEEVSRIIARMMAKTPDDRYANAAALMADLETQEPHRRGGLWLAVAAVAVVVAVAAWFLFGRDPEPARPANGGGQSGPVQPGPGGDTRELRAKAAFLEVRADTGLEPAARIARLRGVARDYPNTDYGKQADAEAKRLQEALDAQAKADALRERRADALIAALGTATAAADKSGDGFALLATLAALPHRQSLADHDRVKEPLAAARARAKALVGASLEGEWKAVQRGLREGVPAGLENRLAALRKQLAHPALPADIRRELNQTWLPRLNRAAKSLTALVTRLESSQTQAREQELVQGLYRGAESALARAGDLDLAGALGRWQAVAKKLEGTDHLARVLACKPLYTRGQRAWQALLQDLQGGATPNLTLAGVRWRITAFIRPRTLKLSAPAPGGGTQERQVRLDRDLLGKEPTLLATLLDPARRGLSDPARISDLVVLCALLGPIPVVQRARRTLDGIKAADPASGLTPAPPDYTSPLLALGRRLAAGANLDAEARTLLTTEAEAADHLGLALRAFAGNRNLEARGHLRRLLADYRSTTVYGVLGRGAGTGAKTNRQ